MRKEKVATAKGEPIGQGTAPPLPPGVKLLHTLRGHEDVIARIAWSPDGRVLASSSVDATIRLWNAETGECLRTLTGHGGAVLSVAFDPTGRTLASASRDDTVKLWDPNSGQLLRSLEGHAGMVTAVAFDPTGRTLASASGDDTVKLWDPNSGQLLRSLEGHTGTVTCVAFSSDGRLIASKGGMADNTIRLWRSDTGGCVATIPEPAGGKWLPGLAFHPLRRTLATVGSDPGTPMAGADRLVHIWELDYDVLLAQTGTPPVSYTSAKIVLVGDSGVGKTGSAGVKSVEHPELLTVRRGVFLELTVCQPPAEPSLNLKRRRRRCCRCCWRARRHHPCRHCCTAVSMPTSATNAFISPSPST